VSGRSGLRELAGGTKMYLATGRKVLPLAVCTAIALSTLAVSALIAAGLGEVAIPLVIAACVLGHTLRRRFVPLTYLVFAGRARVVEQLRDTLRLLQLGLTETDGRVTIGKTGTQIAIFGLGPATRITFVLAENGSARERYLLETILKYQRH